MWSFYSDVSLWSQWDNSIENMELDGNFETGTTGIMHMKNMPPLPFVLEKVVDKTSFSNTAKLGDIKVSFIHNIEKSSKNLDIAIAIQHKVVITGGEKEKIDGIGKSISQSIKPAMEKLLELVEE